MSKTPRGSSTSSVPQVNRWQQHVVERAAWLKERDANPVEVWTRFGLWRSLKDGCGVTDRTRVRRPWDTTQAGSIEPYDGPPPVVMRSKRKYRPGH